jgi:hypothetical protein
VSWGLCSRAGNPRRRGCWPELELGSNRGGLDHGEKKHLRPGSRMEGAGAKEGDAGNLDAVTAGRSTSRGGVVPRAPLT